MISTQLNESLISRYVDSGPAKNIKKAFEFSLISEALQGAPDSALKTECAVVFSDISGFSTLVSGADPHEIKEFLENYYEIIIPIIYKHGGMIDQMLGDGIISVFTPALSKNVGPNVFDAGLNAAEEIVKTFAGEIYLTTKCALHKDDAVICQIGDDNYRQATIVGNIMTAVHRVESVAVDEAVNMLMSIPEAKAMYDKVCLDSERSRSRGQVSNPTWWLSESKVALKGVGVGEQQLLIQKYVGKK